jgi:hypothetical protein
VQTSAMRNGQGGQSVEGEDEGGKNEETHGGRMIWGREGRVLGATGAGELIRWESKECDSVCGDAASSES